MMTLFLKSLKLSGNYSNNVNNMDTANTVNSNYANSYDIAVKQSMIKLTAQAKDAWVNFGASAVDFFKSYTFKEIVFTLKAISFVLSFLALIAIIFLFFKMRALGGPVKQIVEVKEKKKKIKKVLKKWAKIERKFRSGVESNYKLAILDADNLYEEVLLGIGHDKEKELKSLDDIRNAKKLKRYIIDDSGFILTKEATEISLNAYKGGLEELGAL